MGRIKTVVRVDGIPELMERLQSPRLLLGPFQELLTQAVEIGKTAAMEGLDAGTNVAMRSITANLPQGMTGLRAASAAVSSMMPKAVATSIEKGRKRNHPPAIFAANNWLQGRVVSRRRTGLSKEDMKAAVTVVRTIRQRGSKGRLFKSAARQAVAQAMPGLKAAMERKLQGDWKKGAA